MSDSIVCTDCQQQFTLNAGEKIWYEERQKLDPKFKMPKRCKPCREKRKDVDGNVKSARPVLNVPFRPVPVLPSRPLLPTPEERGVSRSDLAKTKPGGDEIRVVLATVDFEDLIAGRSVYCRTNKVRIVLADIGFAAMRAAIDRAEIDKKLAAP
jgi:hypothetical protein